MVFAMERPNFSKAISSRIIDSLSEIIESSDTADLAKYKTLMYLVSDILFNSVQTTEAWSYVRHFEHAMPTLMQLTNNKLRQAGKLTSDRLVKDTKHLFGLWASKSIFDERLTTGWISTL